MYCIALLTLAAAALAVPINQARGDSGLSVLSPKIDTVDVAVDPIVSSFEKNVKRQGSELSALGPVAGAVAKVETFVDPIIANVAGGKGGVVRRQGALVEVTALVKAFVNALVSVLTKANVDVSALVANINLSNSSLLDEIADGNTIAIRAAASPVVATLADIVALLSALIQAALKAKVNVFALLGNLNINYSTILSDVLNDNIVKVGRRELLDVAALVKAIISLVLQVAGFVYADVNAAVANINISQSTIASDILTGNVISVL